MLVEEQSEFQNIKIFDTPLNGRVMALDDIVQITTRDEASYSKMLTHLPAFDLMAQGAPVRPRDDCGWRRRGRGRGSAEAQSAS